MPDLLKSSFMRQMLGTVFLSFGIFFCSTSFAQESQDTYPVLDELPIREMLIKDCVATGARFFQVQTSHNYKLYLLIYGKTQDKPEFACTVRVSAGGSLLEARTYSEQFAAARREKADRGPDYFAFHFPPIGRRAILEATGFGPGGGGYSLTFTTHDGCLDIQVGQSGQLSGQAKPKVDLHSLASALSKAYDQKSKHPSCAVPD